MLKNCIMFVRIIVNNQNANNIVIAIPQFSSRVWPFRFHQLFFGCFFGAVGPARYFCRISRVFTGIHGYKPPPSLYAFSSPQSGCRQSTLCAACYRPLPHPWYFCPLSCFLACQCYSQETYIHPTTGICNSSSNPGRDISGHTALAPKRRKIKQARRTRLLYKRV